jgi:hypothetical protein
MGYTEHTGEEIILKSCPVSKSVDVSNDFNEVRSGEAEKSIPIVPDIASGICHGLKTAFDYRMRIQKEIEDILKRQSFNVPAGASSIEWSNTGKGD